MTSPSSPHAPLNIHATCIIVGERGVLIRGVSGSGKSQLAARLIHRAQSQNRFAALVSDDRTLLTVCHGTYGERLLARPHPAIAGLLEKRGTGLVRVPHEPCATIDLVIDLQAGPPPRMPEAADRTTHLAGLSLPRILCCEGKDDPALAALGLDLWGETVIT